MVAFTSDEPTLQSSSPPPHKLLEAIMTEPMVARAVQAGYRVMRGVFGVMIYVRDERIHMSGTFPVGVFDHLVMQCSTGVLPAEAAASLGRKLFLTQELPMFKSLWNRRLYQDLHDLFTGDGKDDRGTFLWTEWRADDSSTGGAYSGCASDGDASNDPLYNGRLNMLHEHIRSSAIIRAQRMQNYFLATVLRRPLEQNRLHYLRERVRYDL